MVGYVGRRLTQLILVLLGVSVLTFGLGAAAPGDPAAVLLERSRGEPPTREAVEQARRELGLDRPLVVQYLNWLGAASRGDLGQSWQRQRSVAEVLGDRFPKTVLLALAAATLKVLLAVPIGVLAAARRNSIGDHVARVVALLAAAVPSYFLAYLLILLFAVRLRILPAFGSSSLGHMVLPALTLAMSGLASLTRMTRSAVLEVLSEDFVRTATAKGCPRGRVLFRHALRNVLIPITTMFTLSLGHLLGGVVIVETIYAWPGIGQLAVEAIQLRDYPVIQGVVLLAGVIYVGLNFATDIFYGWCDPRVRSGERLA